MNRVTELAYLDAVLHNRNARNAAFPCIITGTAGAGKTSLAVHWAHSVAKDFPDGQLYVNLCGYDPGSPVTPETALAHFLRTLGVASSAMPKDLADRTALFRSLVADQQLLILLDNALSAGQLRPLLPGTPSCFVLVTSRKRLPGLSVREGARSLDLDVLPLAEAVTLLTEVMAEHRPADDSAELAELAQLCAGLPLALRIAAERAVTRPWMTLAELIGDLRDESTLWEALSTADDDESDAVRTVFAWSYRGLALDVARVFRLLGLHPGAEFSLPAAAALAGLERGQVRSLLDALVTAHLIDQIASDRYQFHDLLRAYALGQARHDESVKQQQAATRRVLSWYLHTADAARELIAPGGHRLRVRLEAAPEGLKPLRFTDYDHAVDWYETERANLIAATISAARTGHERMAWQLPAVLAGVYGNRDPVQTWVSAEGAALEAAERAGDRYGTGVLLDCVGISHRKQRKITESLTCFSAATKAFQESSDAFGATRSTHNLGLTYLVDHQLAEARRTFERGLVLARDADSSALRALIMVNLGVTLFKLDDAHGAARHLVEALTLFREAGDETMEARALKELSAVQQELGQGVDALASVERALRIARAQRSLLLEGGCLLELGRLQVAQDAPERALETSQRVSALARRFGNAFVEAGAYDVTGLAYQRLSRHDDAIGFHRQAARIHRDRNESWELAITLDHLANALDHNGDTDEAREKRSEVRELLARFPATTAAALRARISRHRSSRSTGRSRGLDDE